MSIRLMQRFAVVALCAGLTLAYGQGNGQGGNGPGGPPATPPGQGPGPVQPPAPGVPPPQATPGANPIKIVDTLNDGLIDEVLAEYGAAYPAIVFSHISLTEPIEVRLAPLWYLEEALGLTVADLRAFAGKPADLVVFYKLSMDEVVYHAITLTVEGQTYRFRTDDGKPLWNPSGKIKDRKAADPALAPGTVRDLGGTVLRLTPSLFSGDLMLALRGDDGFTYRVRLAAPEELLATDFALHERNRVQLRFALEAQTRHAVALQLTTEAQWTLRLRDENGQSIGPDWE